MDFDRDLEATLRGKLAGGTLDTINVALDALDDRVEKQVMDLLRQGQALTAEQAQQAWYHKYALFELRQRLNSIASQGRSAARRITTQMESPHGQTLYTNP